MKMVCSTSPTTLSTFMVYYSEHTATLLSAQITLRGASYVRKTRILNYYHHLLGRYQSCAVLIVK